MHRTLLLAQACELVAVETGAECSSFLDLDPVTCPFSSDTHAMYLHWRRGGTTSPQRWTEWFHQLFFRWDRLFSSTTPSTSPGADLSAAELKDRANAEYFAAVDYASMNVIFVPPLERESKLPELLAELKKVPEVTDGALPKQLQEMRRSAYESSAHS